MEGGTLTEPLVIQHQDLTLETSSLELDAGEIATNDSTEVLRALINGYKSLSLILGNASLEGDTSTADLTISSQQSGGRAKLTVQFDDTFSSASLNGYGNIESYPARPDVLPFAAYDLETGDVRWFVTASGVMGTAANAAPADSDLVAGQCALWFDKTDGAAKLMVKGKSADGTVVTGSVALA